MNWEDALNYAEDMKLAGYSDWRLPNAKELQSIVDYTRSPDTTDSAAIDTMFKTTSIVNELKKEVYPAYWTGTTHMRAGGKASAAVYVAFGRAMGCMQGRWMDVHGAGCQRSDPKNGKPDKYPQGRGPQGDAIRILNYVRCVRGGTASLRVSGPAVNAPSGQQKTAREERHEPPAGVENELKSNMQQRGASVGGFVQRLDHNGDGKISKQEFDGPSQHFSKFDRNGDGYISEEEAPTGPPSSRKSR
jgi:hypothetical protein